MSADVYARFTLPKLLCLSVGTLLAWLGLAAGAGREPGAGLGRWPLAAPSAACAAVLLLSSLFSLDPAVSVLGDVRLSAYGLLELGLLAALHLAAAAARPEVRIRDVLGAVAASAAALSAYGLAQKAGFEPMPGLALALPEGRITALNGNPVWLGASLLMGLPAALFFALSPRRSERLLGASAFALTAVGVLLTFSRAAWAGAATACAAYALLRAPARRPWLAPAAAAAALAAALVWGSLGGQRHGLMRSDSHRVQFWLASLRAFARDPVLGSGPDTLEAALGPVKDAAFLGALGLRSTTSHAHNDWLQALATTGALGLGAYLWLQLALLRAARDALAGPGREEA
ncbi:O-antigen ligase domain-containing protein, partial [bacterium]